MHQREVVLLFLLGSNDFKSFIFFQDLHLIGMPPSNGKFTWFRGQSKSELDRLFIHPQWLTSYPSLNVSLLKIKDHYLMLSNPFIYDTNIDTASNCPSLNP